MRRSPVTVAYVVALWVLAATTGSLVHGPTAALRAKLGAGLPALFDGHPETLLTSALVAPGAAGYGVATALVVVVLGSVELRWGGARTLVVAVLVQGLGSTLGLGLVALAQLTGGAWSGELATGSAIGPTGLLAGVALAWSAQAGALWRRRIRVGTGTVLLTLVLYGGLLQDVLRLSTAAVGLVVGVVLLPRSRDAFRAPARSSRHETRVLVSVLLAATALGPVLAALSPRAVGPLSVLRFLFTAPATDPSTLAAVCADPTAAEACTDLQLQLRFDGVGPTVLSVLPAVLVVVLALGLRRGRAFAWWAAVVVHLVLSAFGVLLVLVATSTATADLVSPALGPTRATIATLAPLVQPLLVLLVLLATRRSFTVPAPRSTYARTTAVLAATVAAAFALYVTVGAALAAGFTPTPTVAQLARDFPLRLVPAGYLGLVEPTFLPVTPGATVLFEWTGIAVWTVAVVLVLRSFTRTRPSADGADTAAVRALLAQHGRHSLAYLTTWPGHSYWFTPDRRSYVAYRAWGGVAVTTADPVGPAADTTPTLEGFVAFCRGNGWTPCLYSVTEETRDAARGLGWNEVQVAEVTVLPLGDLAFTGKRFQDVRTALNKARKTGVTAEWVCYPDAPRTVTDQVTAMSEEWVAGKGMPEMAFTLGGIDELDDPAVRCLLAVDSDRTVHAITSWLPIHRGGAVIGWTLDFMRRRDTAIPGVMEFLIGTAALAFQAEGAEVVSLSGAPLAQLDPTSDSTGVQKLLDTMGRTLEPVYGFRSLLAFKAKFQPRYHPLYMIYPEVAALPRIGAALTHAYLPRLTAAQVFGMLRGHRRGGAR
ncbi:bifunctional lysylphosphatidylglycerol flippase/synthetase MprF [Rhodococcus aerolatus]